MKKIIAALLALMMALLCVAAMAEEHENEAQKMFDSAWVCGPSTVEAWYMGGIWEVVVSVGYGASKWDYTCIYDEEAKTLVSLDSETNVKSIITIDEEGSEADREVTDTEAKAVFSLNENGRLIWKDEKEDAGAGMEFEKIGWFSGTFACGDYLLDCVWDVEEPAEGEIHSGYRVSITLEEENGRTEWYYACAYDPETNTLSAPFGSKEFLPAGSEAFEIIYDDGSATFCFDDEHNLIWNDETEHTGDDLMFLQTNG